jgi:hypothetical protein
VVDAGCNPARIGAIPIGLSVFTYKKGGLSMMLTNVPRA